MNALLCIGCNAYDHLRVLDGNDSLRFSPLQPPHQLKSLDDLLAQAEHYAGFCMRNSGKMSPTLFLIGSDGPLMFVPTSLTGESKKTLLPPCPAHVHCQCCHHLCHGDGSLDEDGQAGGET
jgi:hypothetical protein